MNALKFGKHTGQPLPTVPGPYLEFLMGKPDLWPDTRAQIAAELKRRGATRPEDTEPLDEKLRGDEERAIQSRCPCCGKPFHAPRHAHEMSAATKRAIAERCAQVNATLAMLPKHLGPCELIAVLPTKTPTRRPATPRRPPKR